MCAHGDLVRSSTIGQSATRLKLEKAPGLWGRFMSAVTQARCDQIAGDLDTAVGIEIEREALGWCRHSLGALAASMVTLVGGDRVDVLRTVLSSANERVQRGFRAYGLSTNDVARIRRLVIAEQLTAA